MIRRQLVPTLLAMVFGSGWFVIISSPSMTLAWTIGLGLMGFVVLVLLFLFGERPLVTFEGLERSNTPRPYVRLGGLHPEALSGLSLWSDRPVPDPGRQGG